MQPKAIIAIIAALVLGLVGGLALNGVGVEETPADDSVAAGFARDMQTHHDQAVQMSWIIYQRTDDKSVRSLAYDIARNQENQSGQMAGWLDVWGLSATGPGQPMDWMEQTDQGGDMGDMGDMGSGDMMVDGRMKGMASEAELEKLRSLRGEEAEILYLQLMIDHHKGALPMAEAVLDSGVEPVENLAQSIITSQTAEVETMTQMLQERGAKPFD